MAFLTKILPKRKENYVDKLLPEREEHLVDQFVKNIEHGRFERMLSGLTAFSAALVTVETYYQHYQGSFGNKWMWSPIVVTPPVIASGVAGVYSRRAAKTALPITAAIYTVTGLIGLVLHIRGVSRRPGGWHEAMYNIVMGPPIAAPGLFAMVGGMGLLAALLRREK